MNSKYTTDLYASSLNFTAAKYNNSNNINLMLQLVMKIVKRSKRKSYNLLNHSHEKKSMIQNMPAVESRCYKLQ